MTAVRVGVDNAISIGSVGGGPPGHLDPFGVLAPAGASWTFEWWIGADDRWRVPANEVAVRQRRVGDVAVVETAMRVPSGDALQRVYGVAGTGSPIVMEVENASPVPFVLALVVRGAARIGLEGATARIEDAFALTTPRAPSRWARTTGTPVLLAVSTGRAETGPFPAARDRAGRLEVALLHPVAHRTTLRAVLTAGRPAPAVDPRGLPDAETAVRAWARLLDRALRVELPDSALNARVHAARAEVLLRGQSRAPGPAVFSALEDWGFEDESAVTWRRLGARERRRAAQRPAAGTWTEARTVADDAEFLVAVRRILVDDHRADTIDVLTDWPAVWRGQALEVNEAPIARGRLSYAVRWHGSRPALLWDAPGGVTLRAPGLDPSWSTTEPRGEALLAAVAEMQ
jgi:hypothetical protein